MNTRLIVGVVALAGIVTTLALVRGPRDGAAPSPPVAERAETAALPQVLEFGRGQCTSCRAMKPVIEDLSRRHEGRVAVRMVDLAEPGADELARKFKVVLIPTQVFVDADGTERFRHQGFISLADLEAEMARLGWTAP